MNWERLCVKPEALFAKRSHTHPTCSSNNSPNRDASVGRPLSQLFSTSERGVFLPRLSGTQKQISIGKAKANGFAFLFQMLGIIEVPKTPPDMPRPFIASKER